MFARRPCAHLAAWGSAWLSGRAAFDDVLDAVSGRGRHRVGPGFDPSELHPVGAALTAWKRAGARTLRLALPVPGDVRGLAGPPAFRQAAMAAGEAVYGPDFGVTAVAAPPTPSSAGPETVWQRGEVHGLAAEPVRPDLSSPDAVNPDPISIAEAEHELAEAIREAATELARRGSVSWLADIGSQLSDARRAGERLWLPEGYPPRAVRLLAQAERLSAVLSLADRDQTGELTSAGMAERAQLLAPVRLSVRRALVAGYNVAEEMADS